MSEKIPKEVLIEPPAFISMILSAVEVFHLESYGLLLGNRGERFVVEHALPLQSAKREIYGVSPRKDREERIRELSEGMGLGIELLGDFHSHTEIGKSKAKPIPSLEDIAFMVEGNIYIILAVNKSRKREHWRANLDKTLSGTLGGYHIKLSAYLVWKGWRYHKLKIVCPIATGMPTISEEE
jgi:proteasome lid subunit RPN8/RPN11